jgi:type II secretory ATPase GspE/PulE/Tfp pilus assembly ATPase PilB-like protein
MHAYGDSAGAPDPRALLADWTQSFGHDGQLQRYRSGGCDKCNGTGFRGRLGLHELMIVNRDLRHLIQTNARSEELQRCALEEGMRTLRQDGIEKVLAGDTSIEEVRATSNV